MESAYEREVTRIIEAETEVASQWALIASLVETLRSLEKIIIEDTNALDHPCCGWGPTDGDTIRVGEARIRLFGIDAPEIAQMCQDAQGRACRDAWLRAATAALEYVVECFKNTRADHGK